MNKPSKELIKALNDKIKALGTSSHKIRVGAHKNPFPIGQSGVYSMSKGLDCSLRAIAAMESYLKISKSKITLKPIRTKNDYNSSLELVRELMDATSKQDLDKLEVISILVEDYENKNFKVKYPSPIRAIEVRMIELNMSAFRLGSTIGGESIAVGILTGRKKLTLGMIRAISKDLDIPAEILIQEY